MARFAHYDKTEGRILGFFDTEINDAVPEPHIEVAEADWPHRFSKRVDISGDAPVLYDYAPPPPTLDELKASALATARTEALAVRKQIAGAANTERALGWVLKSVFAGIGQINDLAANPLLQPLADVAAQGFAIETDITGEDATAIRDRSVEKASAFFLALQLVEGMERLAENQIGAADTPEALEVTIARLRALEAEALTKLAALTEGGNNHV